jgi:hypothetical protein
MSNFGKTKGVAFECAALAQKNNAACRVTDGEIDAEVIKPGAEIIQVAHLRRGQT